MFSDLDQDPDAANPSYKLQPLVLDPALVGKLTDCGDTVTTANPRPRPTEDLTGSTVTVEPSTPSASAVTLDEDKTIEEINAEMEMLLAMKMAKLGSGDGGQPPRRSNE